ncbi:MAG: hypothetical protein MnENMB40S_03590 [Rhizobiaceae bacterium MnEN-MB40S]|nr:MAG: hypothetical protein MnENMB40S_03590 [Rhizobiaceae bacterium MnEN-MB40S]
MAEWTMPKISYDDYLRIARNPDVSDEELLRYSTVRRGEGAFSIVVEPDPEMVEMSAEDVELENAMQMGNGLARYRRQAHFRTRKALGSSLPVLVSECDSWGQFPLLIKEIIDQLYDDFLVWSVGAAGDTAQNMVFGPQQPGRTEYMLALRQQKQAVKGFIFSAAGNDIIGEDTVTGEAVLLNILTPFNGDPDDVEGHINHSLLRDKLDFLRQAYSTVIENVRKEPGFSRLPIFIHGYDYVFPYPWGSSDPRNPAYADNNEWLGAPLDARGIMHPALRRGVCAYLIDRLYEMLEEFAGDSSQTQVWLVDCRGAMPDVSDWNDEIHGTSAGFAKVASRFRPVIAQALASV